MKTILLGKHVISFAIQTDFRLNACWRRLKNVFKEQFTDHLYHMSVAFMWVCVWWVPPWCRPRWWCGRRCGRHRRRRTRWRRVCWPAASCAWWPGRSGRRELWHWRWAAPFKTHTIKQQCTLTHSDYIKYTVCQYCAIRIHIVRDFWYRYESVFYWFKRLHYSKNCVIFGEWSTCSNIHLHPPQSLNQLR